MEDTPEAATKRGETFFAELSKSRTLWGLRLGEGWLSWTDENEPIFPVWSDADSARECADRLSYGHEPRAIPVETFVDDYLPELANRQSWVALNPTVDGFGSEYPAARLIELLRQQVLDGESG